MRYLIVGGGIAAVAAVKAIRACDPAGRVTVISEEKHSFYYRPMTPLVVKGDRERDELLGNHAHLEDIEFIHDRAVSLDHARKEVALATGGRVFYDKLLIATGSSAIVPEIPGIREPHVYFLRTLDDAERLRAAAKGAKRAVVLGGGFVGIKKACALKDRGVRVTVVEQLDTILYPRLDAEGAAMIMEKLRESGIEIITRDSIVAIGEPGTPVELASGKELPAEMVCVAVGVKPNLQWLGDSGPSVELAVRVDARMQTSLDNVYAAGDVVQTLDLVSGKPIVSALWTNAWNMGKVAGSNMAGVKAGYEGSLEVLNASELEGIPMISAGDVLASGPDVEVVHKRRANDYRKLVFAGDRLTGALFVGDLAGAGVHVGLIRSRMKLGSLKKKAMGGQSLSYVDVYTGRL